MAKYEQLSFGFDIPSTKQVCAKCANEMVNLSGKWMHRYRLYDNSQYYLKYCGRLVDGSWGTVKDEALFA